MSRSVDRDVLRRIARETQHFVTAYSISYSIDPRFDQIGALRALKGYKFGAAAGYVNTPEFDDAGLLTKAEHCLQKIPLAHR